jgi:hypothetical protein
LKSDFLNQCAWGTIQEIEKNFLSIIGTFSIYSDRARRTDHEYHIFIDILSQNKKNMKTFRIQTLRFLIGNKQFLIPKSLLKLFLKYLSDFHLTELFVLYINLKESARDIPNHWFDNVHSLGLNRQICTYVLMFYLTKNDPKSLVC